LFCFDSQSNLSFLTNPTTIATMQNTFSKTTTPVQSSSVQMSSYKPRSGKKQRKSQFKANHCASSDSELVSSYTSQSRIKNASTLSHQHPRKYAGPTFHKSPAPSSLPIPVFGAPPMGMNSIRADSVADSYEEYHLNRNGPIPNMQSLTSSPTPLRYNNVMATKVPSLPVSPLSSQYPSISLLHPAPYVYGQSSSVSPPPPQTSTIADDKDCSTRNDDEKLKKHCGQVLLSLLGIRQDNQSSCVPNLGGHIYYTTPQPASHF
jgi:hypothetical protein